MSLLLSPQTRYVLVASPRHDTVAEAVWFADQLRARGIGVSAAVVNRAHPRVRVGNGGRGRRAGRGRGTTRRSAALWANLAELRTIAEREREAVAPLDDRLDGGAAGRGAAAAGDVHDLDGLDEIGRHLFKGVRYRRRVAGNVGGVHILLATDADWLVDEITAALGGPDTTFTVCREGRGRRRRRRRARARPGDPRPADRVDGRDGRDDGAAPRRVGRHAAARAGADAARPPRRRLPRPPSGADGWLIKPLDPLRIQRAVARRHGAVTRTSRASSTWPASSVRRRRGRRGRRRRRRPTRADLDGRACESDHRDGRTERSPGRLAARLRGVAQLG